jgi:uncharacterized protein (TIGR01777 family)
VVETFVRSTLIAKAPSNEVFSWHIREGAFERLNPPWQRFTVIQRKGSIQSNGVVEIRSKIGPLSFKWVVKHSDYIDGKQFRDTQVSGAFSSWTHTHLFTSIGSSSCILEDHIEYSLHGGIIANTIVRRLVNKRLNQMFGYRHRVTREDLRTHADVNKIKGNDGALTIAITGSSGFIGSSLIPFLTTGGHRVIRLVRKPPRYGEDANSSIQSVKFIERNSSSAYTDLTSLSDNDDIYAVVNLAGENISGRWTKQKKKRIFDSRVNTTKSLCKTLSSLDKRPKVLVSASATGYYGDRGDEILTEDSHATDLSSPSINFLSDVCRNWEESTQIAKESGIRVVNIRIGTVLSASGGILAKILPPFKMGLGGEIGSGNQYMSWIAIDDLLGIILHAIADESVTGPINAVSPNPTTNADFTCILGKVLSRPTIFSLPKFVVKAALGDELANAAILSSTRVVPTRLLNLGYQFRFPSLELALNHTLGKSI